MAARLWYPGDMKLDLDISTPRTRGRAPSVVQAEMVRELVPADLALLRVEKGSKPTPLKRLSERHHSLARALAAGMSPGHAAISCGYDISRVSILQSDPAFRELMNFYREAKDAEYVQMHEALAGLSLDAAQELRERLEESPADITVNQLVEITKMGADRTGHGPQSSQTNVNVNIDMAARLEAARKRVAERQQTIEGEVNAPARTDA